MSFLKELPDRLDALGPAFRDAGERADECATRMIGLLEEIRDATSTGYDVNSYEYPRFPFISADTKMVEGREGYVKVIRQLAVSAGAAVDVDVFVGDSSAGFLARVSLTAGGRSSERLNLPVPEAVPVYIVTSAAAQVNLVVERIKV